MLHSTYLIHGLSLLHRMSFITFKNPSQHLQFLFGFQLITFGLPWRPQVITSLILDKTHFTECWSLYLVTLDMMIVFRYTLSTQKRLLQKMLVFWFKFHFIKEHPQKYNFAWFHTPHLICIELQTTRMDLAFYLLPLLNGYTGMGHYLDTFPTFSLAIELVSFKWSANFDSWICRICFAIFKEINVQHTGGNQRLQKSSNFTCVMGWI